MIFSVERAKLLDAVSRLQRVVSAKSSMPVLEGILISAEQGKVTLASYNLEMGMKKEIYAKCDEEGDIVINARLLADILRRMNSLQVEINADEKEAHVVVPFHQLSLAIGKEGQNARLAARLTGYKIDIKSDAE